MAWRPPAWVFDLKTVFHCAWRLGPTREPPMDSSREPLPKPQGHRADSRLFQLWMFLFVFKLEDVLVAFFMFRFIVYQLLEWHGARPSLASLAGERPIAWESGLQYLISRICRQTLARLAASHQQMGKLDSRSCAWTLHKKLRPSAYSWAVETKTFGVIVHAKDHNQCMIDSTPYWSLRSKAKQGQCRTFVWPSKGTTPIHAHMYIRYILHIAITFGIPLDMLPYPLSGAAWPLHAALGGSCYQSNSAFE